MFSHDASLGPEMVKGMGQAYGAEVSVDAMLEACERANHAFKSVMDRVKKTTNPNEADFGMGDWDAVNPQIVPQLGAMSTLLGKSINTDQLVQRLQAMQADLANGLQKDFTLTSPLSTGLVPFDLVGPAKQIYPVYSPIRNKIPRVPGMGTSRKGKRITGIDGSNGVFTSMFLNDLPGGSFGTFNYPTAMSNIVADDKDFPYAYYGLGNNASLLSILAGRGYQDIESLTTQVLLQSMFLQEEGQELFSRKTSALAAPGTPVIADHVPSAGHVAWNSGAARKVYVKITALSGLGETTASVTAGNQTITQGNNLLLSWAPVSGAVAYKVYVGDSAAGGVDPGDGSRFLMTTSGQVTSLELDGPVLGSGTIAPVANTTQQTNGYDGIFANVAAGGDYTHLKAGFSTGAPEIQQAFERVYNSLKADPDEIWLSGSDRLRLSMKLIEDQSNTSAYRLSIMSNERGSITGGQVVTALYNSVTGKEVPLTVHPWIPQGNVLGLSYQLPFPVNDTPNVWEMVMVQDYLGLAFPQIDLARRFAIIAYGGMACWAPGYNFWIASTEKSTLP